MRIQEILDKFVKECSKKLDLSSIIQFGSSTYSKNFKDIDLLLISKEDILPTKEILELRGIIKNFEKRYNDVVFDFSGLNRKRKAEFSITIIFLSKEELRIKYNPNDIFLFKTIKQDKDKKILFGGDVFEDFNFSLTNRHLFEMLVVELKWALRSCLDDLNYRNGSLYHLFKTFLRVMVINEGNFKKENLLQKFKDKFRNEIKLPKNSEKIIKKEIKDEDFEDILKFTENCLRWLVK